MASTESAAHPWVSAKRDRLATSQGRSAVRPAGFPYEFHVALDGNGINGIEGAAGICRFLFDPSHTDAFSYDITYFDGIAAGHAPTVNPDCTVGFLGNIGQHLLLYRPGDLSELDRISTLRFEPCDTTIRGTTHVVWLNHQEFVANIGDWFYHFDIDRLDKPERIVPHGLKLPHALKATASGRFICAGSIDHPDRGEAKEVGIFDTTGGTMKRVALPATCWHVATHPRLDRFYAITYRVLPQEYLDYHQWAIAWMKEYVFEIDAEAGEVTRHWATGRQTPAHLNSDIVLSDTELIWCNGASGTVLLLDLESFASYRMVDELPSLRDLASWPRMRTATNQFFETLCRGSRYTSNQHFWTAFRVGRFRPLDSIYGTALSADQKLLFTANRGMNHISVYDYPSLSLRLRAPMPEIHEYLPSTSRLGDPRLGFHHSSLLSPPVSSRH